MSNGRLRVVRNERLVVADRGASFRMGAVGMLRRRSDSLRVIVAESAKGTATLIAVAVRAIVISYTSELGPIDPQVFITSPGGQPCISFLGGFKEIKRDVNESGELSPPTAPALRPSVARLLPEGDRERAHLRGRGADDAVDLAGERVDLLGEHQLAGGRPRRGRGGLAGLRPAPRLSAPDVMWPQRSRGRLSRTSRATRLRRPAVEEPQVAVPARGRHPRGRPCGAGGGGTAGWRRSLRLSSASRAVARVRCPRPTIGRCSGSQSLNADLAPATVAAGSA